MEFNKSILIETHIFFPSITVISSDRNVGIKSETDIAGVRIMKRKKGNMRKFERRKKC